ncbi:hypothetical protein HGRIS_006628 [Hohenbuehelia grisea]|uniref:F-box domain-containing protein n=1 Tax=Hohenbuehelia grisea TaxID=104357 RepID=A0ABR3JA43_9AGAR
MATTQAEMRALTRALPSVAEPYDNQCFLLRLPNEIIAKIFFYALPYFDVKRIQTYPSPYDAPLLLTNLCHRLTHIVWTTSSLWSCLAIQVGRPGHDVPPTVLQRWLTRAGARPLTLSIVFWSHRQEMFEIIMSTAPRWKTVLISAQPRNLGDFRPWTSGGFPLLESLFVYARLSNFNDIPLCSAAPEFAPRFKKLLVFGALVFPVPLPWGNLRELELRNCDITALRRLSPHTSSLESLTLANTVCIEITRFPITLPNLRRLIVIGNFYDFIALMEDVETPALEFFSCSLHHSSSRQFFNVFNRLIQKSGCLITSFILQFPTAELDDIIPFLTSTSSIQSLELGCAKVPSAPLLRGLTWDPSGGAASMLLPRLSSLVLEAHETDAPFDSVLLDMLQSRSGVHPSAEPAHLGSFTLRTADYVIDPGSLRQVEELCARSGIDFELQS